MKSTPNLPASSRMKSPTGGGPAIKNALKGKPLEMSKGVPSKGAKGSIKGSGIAKKLIKQAK